MNQITNITIDISAPRIIIIHEKQNDSGRWIYATITDNGINYSLPSGSVGLVRIAKPDGTACVYDSDEHGEAVIVSGNTIRVKLVDQALTASGIAEVTVGIYNSSSERITAFNFKLDIERDAVTDQTVVSSDYYNILSQQIGQVLQAKEDLEEMTVTASSLPAGSSATVHVTGGHGDPYNFAFGIPRGNNGLSTHFIAFSDISVSPSMWAADTEYPDYPYKATVPISDAVLEDMVPFIVLDSQNAISSCISPVVETYNGGIYLWGYSNTIEATIKTLLIVAAERGVL